MKKLNLEEFIGKKFGRLIIIGEGKHKKRIEGGIRYCVECKCDCGKIGNYKLALIKTGHTKSCGCLQREKARLSGIKTGKINAKKYAHGRNKGLYGKKNPCRKGGRLLFQYIRNSDQYKKWRTNIFERDNYTCFITGKRTGEKLEAHHKIPFSILIKGLTIETFKYYDPLWDKNNGVTMSKIQHDSFHKKYGKNNKTTYNNLLEFKNDYVSNKSKKIYERIR